MYHQEIYQDFSVVINDLNDKLLSGGIINYS
jgi:hypothetical protein